MEGWKNCVVGDIAACTKNALVGGPFGSNLVSADYAPSGVPVIRGQNMGPERWIAGEFVFVTQDKAKSLAGNLARSGDLVFTQRGTLGQTALVPRTPFDRYIISQSQMKLTVDPGKAGALFVYYLFSSPGMRDYIRRHAIQTGVPHTNLGILRDTPLHLPPLVEQEAIAQVLGTLDDKIELNRRMNETLEAIARAIFKSWFFDFDPVHAKASGRQPFGMNAETAALFSESFENSPIGKIPKGWETGSILKSARLLSGGTPKTERKEYWDGSVLWASAADVSQCGQTFLIDTQRTITERGLTESATQIIPQFCTVVVARGATTGRMALLGREMAMNQTCYALASRSNTPFFLYCLLRHEIEGLVHAAHGSVFDTITTSTFENSQVILPPASVIEQFESQCSPFFQKLLSNTTESITIAQIRDALLPKLISGEIRVKASE